MEGRAADANGRAAQGPGGFSFIPRTTAPSANAPLPRGFNFLGNANGSAPAPSYSALAAAPFSGEQSVARLRAKLQLESLPINNGSAASHSSSSAASSSVTSPYTPDMVQRLAFLNNTEPKALFSVLHMERLKQRQPEQTALPTPQSGAHTASAEAQPQPGTSADIPGTGASLAYLRMSQLARMRTAKSHAAVQSPEPGTNAAASPHPFAPTATTATPAESEASRLAELRQRSSASPPRLSPISTPGSFLAPYNTTATSPASLLGPPASAHKYLYRVRTRAPSPPRNVDVTRGSSTAQPAASSPSPALTAPHDASGTAQSSTSPQYHLLARLAAAQQGLQPPRAVDGSPLLETGGTAQGFVPAAESPPSQSQSQPQPPPTYAASTAAASLVKSATRRTLARKSAAKKEAAAVMLKLRHSAARRSAVTLPDTPSRTADGEGVAGAPTSASSRRDTVILQQLRHRAAPLPVGETAPAAGGVAEPNPFRVDPSAVQMCSFFKYPSQYPTALAPRRPTRNSAPRPSPLPPSWEAAAPFAALASKSVHDAVKASLASAAAAGGGTTNTNARGSGCDSPNDGERWQAMTAVSPLYSYPSTMTPATSAAARAAINAGGRAAARGKGGVPRSEMECLVFDTSSLLESEPGVMNLVLERYRIGIPFTVLDELDCMHKDRGNAAKNDPAIVVAVARLSLGHDRDWRRCRSHELRNWIAASLAAETSHVLVQKRSEVVEEYDRHASTNDDHILGYAVYLQRHLSAPVLFVTEDKFLRIKAKSELGKVYAYADVRRLVGMPPMPVVSPTAAQATAPAAAKGNRKKGK